MINAAWRDRDLVTLFVAVHLLSAALMLAHGGSDRVLLVWTELLDYVHYRLGD